MQGVERLEGSLAPLVYAQTPSPAPFPEERAGGTPPTEGTHQWERIPPSPPQHRRDEREEGEGRKLDIGSEIYTEFIYTEF